MSSLHNKVSNLKILLNIINNYISKVNQFNKNINNVNDQVIKLSKKINKFQKYDLPDIKLEFILYYKEIMCLYGDYSDIFEMTDKIIEDLHIPDNDLSNINLMSSDTYKNTTSTMLNNILLQYKMLNKKFNMDENTFISNQSILLTQKLFKKYDFNKIDNGTFIKTLSYMHELYLLNETSIIFYTNILQFILNKLQYLSNKTFMYILINSIEDYKNESLNSNIKSKLKPTIKNKHIHINNPLLNRFGLVYNSNYLNKEQLIKLIFKDKIKVNTDFKKLSQVKNINFIIIFNNTSDVFKYDIDNIKKAELFKPINYDIGVNENLIKQFTTIKQVNVEKNKWNFSMEVINTNPKNEYIILSNYKQSGEELYRILTPWVTTNKYRLNNIMVENILNYYNQNNKPDRITNYNNLCIKKSINNMFLSKPMSLDIMDNISKSSDINEIQNDVYLKITNLINTLLFKQKKITNSVVLNILKNDKINELVETTLIEKYSRMVNQLNNVDDFPEYETFSTYYYHINNLCIKFMKNIYDNYLRDLPDEKDLKSNINKILDEIIIKNVEFVINGNDNIINIIIFKYLILNYK